MVKYLLQSLLSSPCWSWKPEWSHLLIYDVFTEIYSYLLVAPRMLCSQDLVSTYQPYVELVPVVALRSPGLNTTFHKVSDYGIAEREDCTFWNLLECRMFYQWSRLYTGKQTSQDCHLVTKQKQVTLSQWEIIPLYISREWFATALGPWVDFINHLRLLQ